jgi:hypothetical protein
MKEEVEIGITGMGTLVVTEFVSGNQSLMP